MNEKEAKDQIATLRNDIEEKQMQIEGAEKKIIEQGQRIINLEGLMKNQHKRISELNGLAYFYKKQGKHYQEKADQTAQPKRDTEIRITGEKTSTMGITIQWEINTKDQDPGQAIATAITGSRELREHW